MQTFTNFSKAMVTCKNQNEFSKYLESVYIEFEKYFEELSVSKLNELKFDIEDLLYELESKRLIINNNTQIINAFLILLAQKFEQANMIGAITNILHHLPNSAIKNRLEAAKLYLKVNDISKDYKINFETIISLISSGAEFEEYNNKMVNAILNFYIKAMESFKRVGNKNLANEFIKLFELNKEKYPILKDSFLVDSINELTIVNFEQKIQFFREKINQNKQMQLSCNIERENVEIEQSNYSQQLNALVNPTFHAIRQICFDYIKSIGDPYELHEKLLRGEAIIDDEALLYKYITAYGTKHKKKLYDAYNAIKNKLTNLSGSKLNIIDWGCGQAFGVIMLLEFIKEHDININISDICLIEPSKLALSRGLLHVDVLKSQDFRVKAVNADLDCLKHEDISFENEYKTLHIFSNILDLESFSLDGEFLQKVSTYIKSDNLFVCVSPNINDKRNGRIDLFYKYFDDNFNTELLSARDTNTESHKRYEKIFEVKYTKPEEVEKSRQEIKTKSNNHLDVYDELKSYKKHISPILDLEKVDENIDKDPEYLIFKTRKVAEVITSKIYSNYEDNGKNVSFNDMIRYLSFEKGLFNKKITSNLHTIRTIGNINVHEHDLKIDGQKLDAHLMLISLLILLKELEEKKLF